MSAVSVGVIAKRCGLKVSTIHYYEALGLISSVRNLGNHRRYKKEMIRRISVVKAAQTLGVSLAQVKLAFESLPHGRTPNRSDWEDLSSQWKSILDKKIHALEKLRDSIDSCIGCGCLSLESCPLYNKDDKLEKYGPGPVILNRD